MDDRILKVQMLGGFAVDYGDSPVVMTEARNSKMVQLFQYLLVNRNKMVRQTELIDVLLEDEKCGNPTGTLKNIVYRLRKLLMAVGIPKGVIVYKKSAYGLFGDVIYDIDVERFEQIAREIQDGEMDDDVRLELCLTASDLYKGEFLKKASAEPWVMTKSVYYQERYVTSLLHAFTIVQKSKQYDRLLPALKKAVKMYPYEEDIYLMYISCLHELGRTKDAVAKYEEVASMLYDDLGIGPPDRLRALYKRITSGLNEEANSVIDIRSKLSEKHSARGPYYTNIESFSSIFQFVVRHMERSGKSVFLMLCTFSELDGTPPKIGSRMSKVSLAFQEAVRLTCRKGDVYTRYSPSQFLLMLMELKHESCDVVANRLRHCFYRMPRMSKVRLTCKYVSAADMDNILQGVDLRDYEIDWKIDPEQAEREEEERIMVDQEQAWVEAPEHHRKR